MNLKGHTIEAIADWILKHRNEHVFVGDTKDEIVLGIQDDAKNGNFLYVFDDKIMDFTGVVSYRADYTNEVLFVRNLLITTHSALPQFITYFNRMYPNFCIAANRKNEYVQYNTHRLVHLLRHMKTEGEQ